MTKEELKDKAEEKSIEYVDNLKSASVFSNGLSYTWEQITNAYIQGALDFAEPKEKRITELEAQIKKMKCCGNCDWSNYLPNGNCLDCDGKKNWKLKEIKEK